MAGLGLGLAVGIALAAVDGPWAGRVVEWIEPVGALWVNAIRMTVVPLLVSLLLGGIISSGAGVVARIGGRTLAWFVGLVAFTTLLAAVAAPPLLELVGAGRVELETLGGGTSGGDVILPPFRDWFVGLLPQNPVRAAADGDILPLVIFTVVFGLAATRVPTPGRERLGTLARDVSKVVMVIVDWILWTAPVGVFALTLALAAETGASVVAAVAGLLVVEAFLVLVATGALYPLVRALAGIPVTVFARAAAPAQAVGFSTRSSLASLPPLMEEAERTLGLPDEVSELVLPAAVSVFKYTSPVTRISGTWFVASLFGVTFGPVEWVTMSAGMAALTFYSPGIPSGGLFVLAPLYEALGLPLEGIGILIALDLVPDMMITAGNVTADLAVAGLVAGPYRSRTTS